MWAATHKERNKYSKMGAACGLRFQKTHSVLLGSESQLPSGPSATQPHQHRGKGGSCPCPQIWGSRAHSPALRPPSWRNHGQKVSPHSKVLPPVSEGQIPRSFWGSLSSMPKRPVWVMSFSPALLLCIDGFTCVVFLLTSHT